MTSSAAAVGRHRQAAADDLAQAGEVGRDAEQLLRAARRRGGSRSSPRRRPAGCRRGRRSRAGPRGSRARAARTPMLPATGSMMTAAIWPRCASQSCSTDARSLKVAVSGVGDRARGHAGAGRAGRSVRAPEPAFDQQGVGVAVVAALELDQLVAPGEAAGDAQRAHRRLGAGADEAHASRMLRHQLAHRLGERRLRPASGAPKLVPSAACFCSALRRAPSACGRGSSGPTSRCSRCRRCRRRRSSARRAPG